jgi:hypothetical protein
MYLEKMMLNSLLKGEYHNFSDYVDVKDIKRGIYLDEWDLKDFGEFKNLLKNADRLNRYIFGKVYPYDSSKENFKKDQSRLLNLYKKFGFLQVNDDGWVYRPPNTVPKENYIREDMTDSGVFGSSGAYPDDHGAIVPKVLGPMISRRGAVKKKKRKHKKIISTEMTLYDMIKENIDEFCKKYASPSYKVYLESPLYSGMWGGTIDNPAMNNIRVSNIENHSKIIDNIPDLNLDVYYSKTKNLSEYDFIEKTSKRLVCFSYMKELEDGGMENNSIWNSAEYKDLYFHLFFNYFLPKTTYIQSSDNNTKLSSDFWIKAVKEAHKKNKKCAIVNMKTNKVQYIDENYLSDNFDKIWGNHFHHMRIRIYK